MASINPATVFALTEALLSLIDLFDRRVSSQIDDAAELEEYIATRTAVRKQLMDIAREGRPPAIPAGDDLDHGFVDSEGEG